MSFSLPVKRYRFTGKEKDDESGLYYYGARYYCSWTATFLTVDPLAAKFPYQSSYCYADCSPLVFNDPTGMDGDPKTEGKSNSSSQNSTAGKTDTGGNKPISYSWSPQQSSDTYVGMADGNGKSVIPYQAPIQSTEPKGNSPAMQAMIDSAVPSSETTKEVASKPKDPIVKENIAAVDNTSIYKLPNLETSPSPAASQVVYTQKQFDEQVSSYAAVQNFIGSATGTIEIAPDIKVSGGYATDKGFSVGAKIEKISINVNSTSASANVNGYGGTINKDGVSDVQGADAKVGKSGLKFEKTMADFGITLVNYTHVEKDITIAVATEVPLKEFPNSNIRVADTAYLDYRLIIRELTLGGITRGRMEVYPLMNMLNGEKIVVGQAPFQIYERGGLGLKRDVGFNKAAKASFSIGLNTNYSKVFQRQ